MKLSLGCIADDFTGATDLANNLVRAGMRVIQTIGVPQEPLSAEVDAVVIALKTRTVAPDQAVRQSLQAMTWLQTQGAKQLYFKYCSTFDSWYQGEVRGNIGPVTEALMSALNTDFTIATPAFPDNGRTVFKGHLFVGDVLFAGSIGRTDFPRGNHQDLIDSITQRLWPMGNDTVFIPGHGPESTFGRERVSNPYVGGT